MVSRVKQMPHIHKSLYHNKDHTHLYMDTFYQRLIEDNRISLVPKPDQETKVNLE